MSRSEPRSVADALAGALAPLFGDDVAVEGIQRLSGGASRETWAFCAGAPGGPVQDLVLRRDPPGRPGPPGAMAREASVLRAAARAGLSVPEVLVDDDGTQLGTAGMVMARVPGETIPRRILRDDECAAARSVLAGQIGRFLAGLHALDPATVPGLEPEDALATYWAAYEQVDDVSPTFVAAQRWLEANRPPPPPEPVIVHGDLRLGNLIVGPEGLRAVIDWELVHLGDPVEDLAWVCVKAWRFGAPLPVAGVGTIDTLIEAYEGAGGRPVDRDRFHWWLVQKTLQWGIICMGQAAAHLSGALRSVELATIGRRVAEQEADLLELLAPSAWQAAGAAVPEGADAEPAGPSPGLHGRPTAAELVEAVREFLADTVVAGTTGHIRYHARVAANALGKIGRAHV